MNKGPRAHAPQGIRSNSVNRDGSASVAVVPEALLNPLFSVFVRGAGVTTRPPRNTIKFREKSVSKALITEHKHSRAIFHAGRNEQTGLLLYRTESVSTRNAYK